METVSKYDMYSIEKPGIQFGVRLLLSRAFGALGNRQTACLASENSLVKRILKLFGTSDRWEDPAWTESKAKKNNNTLESL